MSSSRKEDIQSSQIFAIRLIESVDLINTSLHEVCLKCSSISTRQKNKTNLVRWNNIGISLEIKNQLHSIIADCLRPTATAHRTNATTRRTNAVEGLNFPPKNARVPG